MQYDTKIHDLVDKYSCTAPRYTSYPPALMFNEDFDRDLFCSGLVMPNVPLSLYVHLPFCRRLCWFCGCNKVITKDQGVADRYLDYLAKELTLWLPHTNKAEVTQIHFGGGTPNFLTPPQVARLNAILHCYLSIDPDAQKSVELSPGDLNKEHVDAYARLGCRRASLGIQDTNIDVLHRVDRLQSLDQCRNALCWLRQAGFNSVNIDLIYGLPGQSVSSFRHTVNDVLSLNPERIALFNYGHVPWFKASQKILHQEFFPSPQQKIAMFDESRESFEKAGYVFIGLDHFVKRDDELAIAMQNGGVQRDFQGYSLKHSGTLLGVGLSSISQSPHGYCQNHRDLAHYEAALNGRSLPISRGIYLTADDRIRRWVINQIMCNQHVSFKRFKSKFSISFNHYFANEIEDLDALAMDDLITLSGQNITVTTVGRLFLRNISMVFDTSATSPVDHFSQSI